jgi:hypothetical protein
MSYSQLRHFHHFPGLSTNQVSRASITLPSLSSSGTLPTKHYEPASASLLRHPLSGPQMPVSMSHNQFCFLYNSPGNMSQSQVYHLHQYSRSPPTMLYELVSAAPFSPFSRALHKPGVKSQHNPCHLYHPLGLFLPSTMSQPRLCHLHNPPRLHLPVL